MFLLKDKDQIIKESENYFEAKVEIDFFVELRGENTYLTYLCELKKHDLPRTYNLVVLLDQYTQDWYSLCFTYISLFEDYLRHILYRGDFFINNNSLKEIYLPSLLEIISSNKEIYSYLFPLEIDKHLLLNFRRKILEHHLVGDEKKNAYIINFYNALPDTLKDYFYLEYEKLNEKYKDLKSISLNPLTNVRKQ